MADADRRVRSEIRDTWDGENLKLCWGEPGGGTRPTDFTTTPEGGFLVVVKRQDP
jgi:hypothetical protein